MDNDSDGYLAAGLFLANEKHRQASETAAYAQMESQKLAQQSEELNEQLERHARQAQEVEDDYWALFNLLKQPMEAIAQRNRFFARTYEAAQSQLADIRVRELAFTELAYQLGAKLGMSSEEVRRTGLKMRADVLQNRFPNEHGTNASVSPVLRQRGTSMLQQWDAERNTFLEKYKKAIKIGQIYELVDGEPDDWKHAYQVFLGLAKQGKREAQLNLAHCLMYGDGIERNPNDAEHWCLTALKAGEPRAALKLHLFHAWKDGGLYSEEKAESYLKLAEQQGHQSAPTLRKRWEGLRQAEQWSREEATLLQKLLTITAGKSPAELEQIKGRAYVWEKAVRFLHACQYRIVQGETVNEGSFFSPKRYTRCHLHVTNPTDVTASILANFKWDNAKHGKRENWAGSKGAINQQTTSPVYIGCYPKGAEYDHLEIWIADDAFKSLTRFGQLCPSAVHGYLILKLQPAEPFVV